MKKLYYILFFYSVLCSFSQVQVGGLFFEKMYFYTDTLYEDTIKLHEIQVSVKYENIRFIRYEAPAYIRVDLPATYLEKGKKYSLPLYVSAARIEKLGHFQTIVKLYTNEEKEQEKILYVSGIVRPVPKKYTAEELAHLPQIKIDTEKNIGTVKKGKIIPVSFKISNIGFAPLRILNIKTECGCTHWQNDTTAILPNQSSVLTFDLNTQDLNLIHSEIWLWTNAANAPEVKLLIKGKIQP